MSDPSDGAYVSRVLHVESAFLSANSFLDTDGICSCCVCVCICVCTTVIVSIAPILAQRSFVCVCDAHSTEALMVNDSR